MPVRRLARLLATDWLDNACVETVRLLPVATPEVFRAPCFALKGGTTFNLFVQEMPRLDTAVTFRSLVIHP